MAQYHYALGRRKTSTARVRVQKGKGNITINEKTAAEYFADAPSLLHELNDPFRAISSEGEYDVSVRVNGGGHHSQVGAIKLGIAKALASLNEDLKGTLKRADLLGRDPRAKERKKFGLKGARKQRQFTKR
ncbi:MAG: 30S ribosomal protein S9 [Patescibacteria group bacterium]